MFYGANLYILEAELYADAGGGIGYEKLEAGDGPTFKYCVSPFAEIYAEAGAEVQLVLLRGGMRGHLDLIKHQLYPQFEFAYSGGKVDTAAFRLTQDISTLDGYLEGYADAGCDLGFLGEHWWTVWSYTFASWNGFTKSHQLYYNTLYNAD